MSVDQVGTGRVSARRVLVWEVSGLAVREIALVVISKAAGGGEGGGMASRKLGTTVILLVLMFVTAMPAAAQSFRVQCPTSTITHPTAANNNSEPAYSGATTFTTGAKGFLTPATHVNGAIKCQQISGGDGYATMGDGTQTYMFSFGPLSGLADIANGLPGTEFPGTFMSPLPPLAPGDPATTDGIVANTWLGFPLSTAGFTSNGAVGLTKNIPNLVSIYDNSEAGHTVTVVGNAPLGVAVGDQVTISGADTTGYNGTWTVATINVVNPFFPANYAFTYTNPTTGLAEVTESSTASAGIAPTLDGHVDPRPIMDVGVMNGNIPAPMMAIDEDDEFFLTLTNVGMIMRPDLFEQHTVHFHGYPNASSFYDGVPDASVAINIGGSFTYYYLAPDAGTYFWHCHITPPEHLQMGMVGQLYVRPRQNRVNGNLQAALLAQEAPPANPATPTTAEYERLRKRCGGDILCSTPIPAVNAASNNGTSKYAYNDGDGSTRYDVEYPLQMHGFDPNFHFVGMTFNPESFVDLKDKYFLLNGRSYPDTIGGYTCQALDTLPACNGHSAGDVVAGPMTTQSTDGTLHASQPLPAVINIPVGGRALLRISDLNVTEFHTLASLGIPMHVIGINARLLRDADGTNMAYDTNSITLGGGESLDVILDACSARNADGSCNAPNSYSAGQKFYLYTPQLDHLSNDAENFGGMMTEVNICTSVNPDTKVCS